MKTLVLGASPNPDRYAYKAVVSLLKHGHEVLPLGTKRGAINGNEIINGSPELKGVDTVTLYINAAKQKDWSDYILALRPRRIIFNPGAENTDLQQAANQRGIETINACTLVMLAIGVYEDKTAPRSQTK